MNRCVMEKQVPRVEDACILCGKCVDNCPYVAMEMRQKQVIIDADQCFSCHLCMSLCPVNAIVS